MSSDSKPKDLLGLAPYGEAIKSAVEIPLQTIQKFLFDIGGPAAAELGLLFRDEVRAYRAKHLMGIGKETLKHITITAEGAQLKAPPRILHEVIEHGSWCEDEELQKMWAGLLAGSCSIDGRDESNLIFTDVLKRLSSVEGRLLAHVCQYSVKKLIQGHFHLELMQMAPLDIAGVTRSSSGATFDYQIDHMRTLGLLQEFKSWQEHAILDDPHFETGKLCVTPTMFGLNVYIRCCGSKKSPQEFFPVS
jgi:hypothetical protein